MGKIAKQITQNRNWQVGFKCPRGFCWGDISTRDWHCVQYWENRASQIKRQKDFFAKFPENYKKSQFKDLGKLERLLPRNLCLVFRNVPKSYLVLSRNCYQHSKNSNSKSWLSTSEKHYLDDKKCNFKRPKTKNFVPSRLWTIAHKIEHKKNSWSYYFQTFIHRIEVFYSKFCGQGGKMPGNLLYKSFPFWQLALIFFLWIWDCWVVESGTLASKLRTPGTYSYV